MGVIGAVVTLLVILVILIVDKVGDILPVFFFEVGDVLGVKRRAVSVDLGAVY